MKYLEGQIISRFGQLLRAHAETVTGAYKQKRTQQMVEGGGFRDLTEEEKLRDMIAQMGQHNDLLRELCDALPAVSEVPEALVSELYRGR